MDKVETSDKIFKFLVKFLKALTVLLVIVVIANFILDKYIAKKKEEQANAKLPTINERIDNIVNSNSDIYGIKRYFEYDGINFIEVYIKDTWFVTPDIQKKRFTVDIRDNVKAILFEEGFIEANDRVGIYVYSYEGIPLAESGMHNEIKLKE